ncbi:phosphoglycerate dehydrogenase [Phenylobacterium sp.]|uniref:phosphoglycerate dehydrogenase n=1 Tax=Phenylobacterium sp. TaxID=1871053 RepID=UPI00273122AA|nr:phosphoglycerate dehydrogenase [Phenylobacterium sp.]MDP1619259.1 phosphoglycerate dehydrogenase [Phenylobacterium sp.]MDP1989117.1 phosphoglycerate dehydrogenase [Phenylobacterium sp.]
MAQGLRRVVVTQKFFDAATIAYLEQAGCQVVLADLPPGVADGGLDHDQLVERLSGAQGWIVGHAQVTRQLMEALPDLAVIARRGVGYERVDLEAARDLGRVVTIAAGGNDASVADQVIGMMIALGRRFREAQGEMIGGSWSILLGSDLYRKTVGVVGLGRIGKSVVQRLSGFEAQVLVATARPDPDYAARTGVRFVDLETLLAQSDYVTLHAPLTPATRHMINSATLKGMKPGAFLINTARGGLVSDRDLLVALGEGRLGGAGLDVFESESDPVLRPVTDALIRLPNVVAAPHAGASTREGLERTNMIAARCVVAVFNGESLPGGCVVADGRTPETIP